MEVQEIMKFLKQFPEDMEMLVGCHSIYDGHAELCSFKRFDTTCVKQDGKHLCIYGYNDGARCTKKKTSSYVTGLHMKMMCITLLVEGENDNTREVRQGN